MATYHFRGEITRDVMLRALGAGVGAGLAVAYLTQVLLRKETLPSGATPGEVHDPAPPAEEEI